MGKIIAHVVVFKISLTAKKTKFMLHPLPFALQHTDSEPTTQLLHHWQEAPICQSRQPKKLAVIMSCKKIVFKARLMGSSKCNHLFLWAVQYCNVQVRCRCSDTKGTRVVSPLRWKDPLCISLNVWSLIKLTSNLIPLRLFVQPELEWFWISLFCFLDSALSEQCRPTLGV